MIEMLILIFISKKRCVFRGRVGGITQCPPPPIILGNCPRPGYDKKKGRERVRRGGKRGKAGKIVGEIEKEFERQRKSSRDREIFGEIEKELEG